MDTWIECAWFKCRKRFEPGRRASQHYRCGGRHHKGALYCSRACQQKAYRFRRDTAASDGAATVTQETGTKGPACDFGQESTIPHATVTPTESSKSFQGVTGAKNEHPRPANAIAGPVSKCSAESLKPACVPLDHETAAYHRQQNDRDRIRRETAWGRKSVSRPAPAIDGAPSDWQPWPAGWQPISSAAAVTIDHSLDIPDFLLRATPQRRAA